MSLLPSQIQQSQMGIWVHPDKINLFKDLEGSYPYNLGAEDNYEQLYLSVNIIDAQPLGVSERQEDLVSAQGTSSQEIGIGTDNIATCTALGCYTKTATFLIHLDSNGCVGAALPIIYKFLTLVESDDKIWYLCNGYLFFDEYLSDLVELFTTKLTKNGTIGYMGVSLNRGQHFAINIRDGTYRRESHTI